MVRAALFVLIVAVVALYSCEPEDCHKCDDDKVWNDCGSACPPTCEYPEGSNRPCTLNCVIGCECKPGLYTQEDGSCIDPSECPKKCD